MLARLNALIRRAAGYASPVLVVGPLQLDTSRQLVSISDKAIDLTAFEYRVLEHLMLNADRIVSKNELTEHLYAQDFDRDSNVIEVFVVDCGASLNHRQLIQTVRGRGYQLNPGAHSDALDA